MSDVKIISNSTFAIIKNKLNSFKAAILHEAQLQSRFMEKLKTNAETLREHVEENNDLNHLIEEIHFNQEIADTIVEEIDELNASVEELKESNDEIIKLHDNVKDLTKEMLPAQVQANKLIAEECAKILTGKNPFSVRAGRVAPDSGYPQ